MRKIQGLRLTNTKHSYYEVTCHCGHITIKEPHRSNSDGTLQDINCSQWRLVGPGLAALIICLTYRMRLSRERVQEFLCDWLGLQISVGTINNTLHESGAAAMPIEAELVKEVVESIYFMLMKLPGWNSPLFYGYGFLVQIPSQPTGFQLGHQN